MRVGSLSDLAEAEPLRVVVGDRALSIIRIGDDVYVIGDVCSHAEVSLSEGEVDAEECTIECPKHGSAFDLRTGEPLSLPALKPVPSYIVSIVDGDVVVELDGADHE